MSHLVKGGQDPALREGQLGEGLGPGEIGGGGRLGISRAGLAERHLQELAGVPELVGQVARTHHSIHGQVQILPGRRACAARRTNLILPVSFFHDVPAIMRGAAADKIQVKAATYFTSYWTPWI